MKNTIETQQTRGVRRAATLAVLVVTLVLVGVLVGGRNSMKNEKTDIVGDTQVTAGKQNMLRTPERKMISVNRDTMTEEDFNLLDIPAGLNALFWCCVHNGMDFWAKLHIAKLAANIIASVPPRACGLDRFEEVPQINPKKLFEMTNAVYASANNDPHTPNVAGAQYYLNSCGAHVKVLETYASWPWASMLMLDEITNNLWVIFRGTVPDPNQVGACQVLTYLTYNSHNLMQSHFDKMGQQIIAWRAKYAQYKFYAFAGHSAGGLFTNEVLPSWQLFRVAVDSDNRSPEKHTSPLSIFLRAATDPLSTIHLHGQVCVISPYDDACMWAGHDVNLLLDNCVTPLLASYSNSTDYLRVWLMLNSYAFGIAKKVRTVAAIVT